jgi:hypothetical protein
VAFRQAEHHQQPVVTGCAAAVIYSGCGMENHALEYKTGMAANYLPAKNFRPIMELSVTTREFNARPRIPQRTGRRDSLL